MHNAPPVFYPVGRFVWGLRLNGLLALLAAVALWAWQGVSESSNTQSVAAALCWLLSVSAAIVLAQGEFLHDGQLVWDGQAWCWQDSMHHDHPVDVQVLLDVGGALFMACQGCNGHSGEHRRRQFALLVRTTMPLSWHGFRCAVYSRPMSDARPERRRAAHLEI
jgi:hypothetical protein